MAESQIGLSAVLAKYESEHALERRFLLPVEDQLRLMPGAPWQGGYRWFRSANIICLEKIRLLKSRQGVRDHGVDAA